MVSTVTIDNDTNNDDNNDHDNNDHNDHNDHNEHINEKGFDDNYRALMSDFSIHLRKAVSVPVSPAFAQLVI